MSFIVRLLRRAFWVLCKLCPVKRNKIVFQSYYGRGYGDNPKYIAEELRRRNTKLDMVWVIADESQAVGLPPEFRTVIFRSFRYIYEMSTARVWVDNSRKEYCMKKKNQYYMQTWHGGMGMKKVENMVADKLGDEYVRRAMRDAAQCDVMLSGTRTSTDDYRRYFWYPEGEILEKGLPRNDRLLTYTADDVARVKAALGVEDDCRLLLYAPTFRDDHSLTAYDMDYRRQKAALEARFGGTWKIAVRLHPNVFRLSDTMEFDPDAVINASHYPDMQELYMAADMVVTDYSSVIFDFLLIGRPSLLYASDIAAYKTERDYYFEFADLPFTLCENNDQMEQAILHFDETAYAQKIGEFKAYHGFCDDGNASRHAADWILDKVMGESR